MTYILGTVQSIIFLSLGVIHLSWAFGSEWGFENALPTNEDGEKVLNPGKKDSAMVGVGLLLFALFYRIKIGALPLELPVWVIGVAGWMISTIFLLRAMGDFKYIGFFKRVRSTEFGQRDSKYYSPLCMFIGLNGILLEMNPF